MTFTTVNLTGERVLVKGTDRFGVDGQTVLDATEWNEVKRHSAFADATEDFDSKVEEFFAPLMVAADQLESALARPTADPIGFVTIHEGTEAVAGRDEVTIKLSHDSIVLRLIEENSTDRLVWVLDHLEVMSVEDAPAAAADSSDTTVHDEQA